MRLNILTIVTGIILLFTISCEEKEEEKKEIEVIKENEKPSISFVQPAANLIISKDTIISFIAEAYDGDGTIDKIEFSIDGMVVKTVSDAPYIFEWDLTTEDNIGIRLIKATAFDNTGAEAETEIQIEIISYLSKWTGNYEGTSQHWSSFPCETDGQWQIIDYHSYKKVLVNVELGDQDSCLHFNITYDDSLNVIKNDVLFSTEGNHFSHWGGGSGYGSLNISFKSDTIHYRYFQMCGMPCRSGINFVIGRKK